MRHSRTVFLQAIRLPGHWAANVIRKKEPAAAITETAKTNSKEKVIMKPNIDLSEEQRDGVVKILNALLSDEYLLYTKTRTTTGT